MSFPRNNDDSLVLKASLTYKMLDFRLRGSDIVKVFKTGFRLKGNGLFLYAIPSEDECNRLAVVVRKKLFKSAVDRNRVRRILRECLRNSEYLQSDKKYWIVFDLKQWENTLAAPLLYQEGDALLKKVR